ncbi:MAG TPA: galactose oxidase-like domain-containing protein [Solirubrobacteraceae bacterium]|nr:galactose oxidase-like domain-containing protein [Solirubrobacteraceae bacterium]
MTLATVLVAAGPAGAHGTGTLLSAPQERKLERVERQTLGPEHAAEHAELRTIAAKHVRWLRGLSPAARRRVKARERAKARAHTASVHAAAALAGDPADVGRWTTGPTSIPVMGINAAVLPTGKVLFWAYPANPNPLYNPDFDDISEGPNNSVSAVWDPRTGQTKVIPPPINPDTGERTNLWCSGISFLPNGEVLATGGNLGYSPNWKGLDRAYIFNPWTETWREVGRMHGGRWYPSQVLLSDGRTLVLQGYDESGTPAYNTKVDVFDPATGQFTLVGNLGGAGPPVGNYYPHTFLMPSGRVLVAGPDRPQTFFFDNPGNDMSFTAIPHPGPTFQDRQWGTAVLLPGGASGPTKVMMLGGSWLDSPNGVDAVNTTEVFDEADAAAGWNVAPSLNVGRGHANTVLLPDGTMVEVGGGRGTTSKSPTTPPAQYAASGAEKQVELWNPATGQWRLGPAQVETRAYHSTAVLLPDGRVVSAGDDYDGPGGPGTGLNSDTLEIYSPPYLFKGARPTVTSAPQSLRWNTRFGVGTPNTDITRAVLMAPSATTHATDMNQRMLNLSIAKRADGLGYDVTSPAGATAAPPGVYMLFLLNSRGVPSVARWLRLDPNAPPPPKLVRPPAPPAKDTTPPDIVSARVTKRRVKTRGRARGTKFIVRTSEAARLRIQFQRARSTRRTRFVDWGEPLSTGSLHRTARVKFSGKLHGRRLRVGRWRAVIEAIDAAGNRSAARRVRFSVIRSG